MLNGEYRIKRVLGSGGFANTYLATDLSLKRDVAIKEYFPSEISIRIDGSSVRVKAPSYDTHFNWGMDRFVREAKTLAKFRHPNIVRVFRTFDANDTAYTVLDFVNGADMEAWLKGLGRLPRQDELDRVMSPILDALEKVHAAKILHRDIKPANIYIRSADQAPVLLDFGAARFAAAGEFTGTTAAIVSRGYSPHEAYATDSKLQGPWTDIYGLAATIHRALSGKEPVESTLRVLEDGLVPARDLKLTQPFRNEFLDAIDWGLNVLPNERPHDVGAWRQLLFAGTRLQDGPITGPRSAPRSRP
ncbi:MAG: serine/threonine-protein kinase, partial [Pseudomonadota bacterium]